MMDFSMLVNKDTVIMVDFDELADEIASIDSQQTLMGLHRVAICQLFSSISNQLSHFRLIFHFYHPTEM